MAVALTSISEEENQNFETYCLIWVDACVSNSENLQAQKQLRASINHLVTFEDDQNCLKYIQSVPKDDRIVLIVSGRLGEVIVPKIVKYRQVTSIYVYCMNKAANEKWTKPYEKVKAVVVELDELLDLIKTDQSQRMHKKIDESLPIHFIHSGDSDHGQSTTELGGDFIHSQLLISCLMRIKPDAEDRKELISICKQQYKGNSDELKIVEEFERDYLPDRVLWWYTRESFLYQMLNKALRVQNIHLLFLFRFIIGDIEQQLKKHKCSSKIHVYRAQLMSREEVQLLKDSLGELISINSFFSTSLDRQLARSFLPSKTSSNDLERVFFEIDADPHLKDIKPFSDISSYSSYPAEKEVLFMIGSIFRLVTIDRDQEKVLNIRMKLCSNDENYLKELFQHMQKRYAHKEIGLLAFADVLRDMGKWNDAEKYYHRTLAQLPNNDCKHIGGCYHALGSIARQKGDYQLSLNWYNKSLEMEMQRLKPDDTSIAHCHRDIGSVYETKKEYSRALESFEKALVIYKVKSGDNSLNVASCMDGMGNCYYGTAEYLKALELYQQALSIREKHLPDNHCDLGLSHGFIGRIYKHFGDYELALVHYKLKLKIYKRSRPPHHPSLGHSLENIGLVYEKQNAFQQALSCFEQEAAIYRHSLPPTHSDIVKAEENIHRVSSKLK